MKKLIFFLFGIVFLICNVHGQITKEKLCKTWHMDRTISISENAYAKTNWLSLEYRLSYLKFDCPNMTFAYNGLSKQDDGSYKEYYVHNGTWELFEDQQKLVQHNMWAGAASKEDTYLIVSLTDNELILMKEYQFDKQRYTDGRIGIAFLWVYFCDK